MDLSNYRRGRKSHLTKEQEDMVAERLLFATRSGFAADVGDTKLMMARIAALSGRPYKNGTPSSDMERLFRAKHHELSYRRHECKDKAKANVESFEHADPFFEIVEGIGRKNPGLLPDGNQIWILDETDVSTEFGARVRVFSDSTSHHRGARSAHVAGGSSRHVTLVIAASVSGKKCPPFFIVEGKNVMQNWFQPLPASLFNERRSPLITSLTSPDWFPRDGAIYKRDSGSMKLDILRLFVMHLNSCVRHSLPSDERFLLTIDSYASRKGIEWLEECVNDSCDAVPAPANTSHFLQPCDQISKGVKREIRNILDELSRIARFDHKTIRFKLMYAVIAHSCLTTEDCVIAFCKTGKLPFNRRFANPFMTETIDLCQEDASDDPKEVEKCRDKLERKTADTIREIFLVEGNDSRMLQRLSVLRNKAETTNRVLMSIAPCRSASSANTMVQPTELCCVLVLRGNT